MSRGPTVLVELGSNSVRLMLARIEPGVAYRVLRDERLPTRLGAGVDGWLPAAAVMRTVEAVTRFVRAVPLPPDDLVGVATAAVREAPNAAGLLDALRREAGLDVEILTADEEARLGALAARSSLQLWNATVVDVGGGSLQIASIREGEPVPIASAPLGMLRATRRFLVHDPPHPEELDALRLAVREAVAGRLPGAHGGQPLVGIGGTARALGRLGTTSHSSGAGHRVRLPLRELGAICGRLTVMRLGERRQIARLKPERADVIVAGAVIFDELLRLGGYASLLVAQHGVRHGALLRQTFERVPATA